jgi:hypothetical protein
LQVTAVSAPPQSGSQRGWAALGPQPILAGKLGGPSGPSTPGIRLHHDHAV